MKELLKNLLPPVLYDACKSLRKPLAKTKTWYRPDNTSEQELGVYWTEDMAFQLENWGKAHTWIEIECLLANCRGKVLDIACGTGVNIIALQRFPQLDLHGFDISDFLIQKALLKGIEPSRLKVEDATKTSYGDKEFAYSYSIGSLEHFTEEGIDQFLQECSRYTSISSFHMVPVSESDQNEGWIRTNQSYHNNSVEWWLSYYRKYFTEVQVINSGYKDLGISAGKWFVCVQ